METDMPARPSLRLTEKRPPDTKFAQIDSLPKK
jgi:hypothetical protein